MGKYEYYKIGGGCNVMCVMFLFHASQGEVLPEQSEYGDVTLVAVSNQLKCFLCYYYHGENLRLWHYEKKEFVKSIILPDGKCLYFNSSIDPKVSSAELMVLLICPSSVVRRPSSSVRQLLL